MRIRVRIVAIGIGVLLAPPSVSLANAQGERALIAAHNSDMIASHNTDMIGSQHTDLAGFIRVLDDLSKRVAASDAAHAHDILERLPPAWRVRHGSEDASVTTEWIAAPLRQASARPDDWTKARAALVERIDAAHREALDLQADDEARDDTSATAAGARAALSDVLARTEFKQRDGTQWSNSLRQRIQQWLTQFAQKLPIGGNAASTVTRVLAWLVTLGALAALGTYLYRARLPRRSFTPLAIEVPRPSSAEWAERAYAALRAGDAREAMHCGYHAVLFRLEEQGLWRVDDTRTPREYVRLLPAQDARRAAFLDLTRRFEQTWYGSRTADGQGLQTHLEAFGCSAPSKPTI